MKEGRPFCSKSEIEKELFQKLCTFEGKYNMNEVFRDFLQYCAHYISNLIDGVHRQDRREALEELNRKYDGRFNFHECLQLLARAMQENQERGELRDVLGTIFEAIGLSNERNGQFFTPENISRMMAKMMIGDKVQELQGKPYIMVSDPCVGSGRMLLAFANELQEMGYNYCEKMAALAVDVDMTCVFMSYIQLSLYGVPAAVLHGNSLTVEEWSRWYTPAYVWGGWVFRQNLSITDRIPEDDLKLQDLQKTEFLNVLAERDKVS